MKKGIVKFYNNEKGFGFIIDNETQKDIFVHSSGLKNKIAQGDSVRYDTEMGKKGLQAIKVEVC